MEPKRQSENERDGEKCNISAKDTHTPIHRHFDRLTEERENVSDVVRNARQSARASEQAREKEKSL